MGTKAVKHYVRMCLEINLPNFLVFFQEKYFANHVSMTNQKRTTQYPKIGPETQDPNEGPLSILEFAFLE